MQYQLFPFRGFLNDDCIPMLCLAAACVSRASFCCGGRGNTTALGTGGRVHRSYGRAPGGAEVGGAQLPMGAEECNMPLCTGT
jgi:hypothetical protein